MSSKQTVSLTGKVALVTGASAGIGQATALRLADCGMRVAVCARRLERLEALKSGSGELLPIQADFRKEDDILRVFTEVRKAWGGVDVLVNNAGLGHMAPLLSGATEQWRDTLEVNVLALSICTREAVSDMRRRGDDGHVVHISSMASHRVPPGSGMYSASKYAVRALTEALRQELREAKSKIRVSAVSPGFVETEFAEHYHADPAAAERTYGRFKVLESEDIAWLVQTLISAPPHVQIHDVLVRPRDQVS